MSESKSRRAWKSGYGWHGLVGDASGGFIAALVALPYGLALARLMGLPAEFGLFTSILTAPITSLFGRNPVLIGGTASATVPFIAAAVRAEGPGGAAKVCLVAAVFLMIFCVLRLGRYVAKVPQVGCVGLFVRRRRDDGDPPAPHIARPARRSGRLPRPAPSGSSSECLANLGGTRWQPLVLGLIVIVAAFWANRRWPRSPAALLGVGLAAIVGLPLSAGMSGRLAPSS